MSPLNTQRITVETCREWRNRHERGRSVGQIADTYGRGRTTVRRHVHDRCSHAVADEEWGTNGESPCPLCGETYEQANLRQHLRVCPGNEPPEPVATDGGESA